MSHTRDHSKSRFTHNRDGNNLDDSEDLGRLSQGHPMLNIGYMIKAGKSGSMIDNSEQSESMRNNKYQSKKKSRSRNGDQVKRVVNDQMYNHDKVPAQSQVPNSMVEQSENMNIYINYSIQKGKASLHV